MRGKGGGQPTKYKPEYCEMLIEHFKKGKSYTAFAALLNVHLDTLYQWEKDQPKFSESKKAGWHHYQAWWEEQGQEGLYNQTFVEGDGSKRSVSINSAIWIFNMKCRFRKDWHDAQHIEAKVENSSPDQEARIQELKEWYKKLLETK